MAASEESPVVLYNSSTSLSLPTPDSSPEEVHQFLVACIMKQVGSNREEADTEAEKFHGGGRLLYMKNETALEAMFGDVGILIYHDIQHSKYGRVDKVEDDIYKMPHGPLLDAGGILMRIRSAVAAIRLKKNFEGVNFVREVLVALYQETVERLWLD
ncbi:MAG: hypothetical protein Q9222_005189 [Ikaeria aurantiellina]